MAHGEQHERPSCWQLQCDGKSLLKSHNVEGEGGPEPSSKDKRKFFLLKAGHLNTVHGIRKISASQHRGPGTPILGASHATTPTKEVMQGGNCEAQFPRNFLAIPANFCFFWQIPQFPSIFPQFSRNFPDFWGKRSATFSAIFVGPRKMRGNFFQVALMFLGGVKIFESSKFFKIWKPRMFLWSGSYARHKNTLFVGNWPTYPPLLVWTPWGLCGRAQF